MPIRQAERAGHIPRTRTRLTRTGYHIAEATKQRLTDHVNKLVRVERPKILDPRELVRLSDRVDANQAVRHLPPGYTATDFIKGLELSYRTEAGTDSYADMFQRSSERYGQPWLGYFIEALWKPDEKMHRLPFRTMLNQLAYTSPQLDRMERDAEESVYETSSGLTPVHKTFFGNLQEYVTALWYHLQMAILIPTSREAAVLTGKVASREVLHRGWYGDLTAIQVAAHPELLPYLAEVLLGFEMPGYAKAPELQEQAARWLPLMGADLSRMRREIMKIIANATKTPEITSKLLIEITAQKGEELSGISNERISAALAKYGDPVFGLLGEAFMLSVHGPKLFDDQGVGGKVRGHLRHWAADHIVDRLVAKAVSF